jgi:predicted O-methyltransferase YrrM
VQFAEAYAAEDLVLQTARSLAREVGLAAVTPGSGSVLSLLAAAGSAKAVVEIGTGTGVSGVWLLRGMRADGVLTTIDVENEHQRIARRIFQEAGYAASRTRIITGRALDVLPRLADGVYDLIFVDADATEFGACAEAALRLLRPGGVLAVHGALAGGRIGDPAARDADTVTIRETVRAIRESEQWIPTLLPSGGGLLVAVKRP